MLFDAQGPAVAPTVACGGAAAQHDQAPRSRPHVASSEMVRQNCGCVGISSMTQDARYGLPRLFRGLVYKSLQIYMCVYIYIKLYMYIDINTYYACVYVCVYMYIYICIFA